MMRALLVVGLSLILMPSLAYAAVNINTADSAALDTLPGIGAVKAQAIIDYREQNGPFASIEDIQNVSGIGPATYANIKSLIAISGSSNSETSDSHTGDTKSESTKTTSQTTAESASAEPVAFTLSVGADRVVIVGADTVFSAQTYDKSGVLRTDTTVIWSFGDGTTATGSSVSHTYYAQGDYAVVAQASTRHDGIARASFVASAIPVSLRITSVSVVGIAIKNEDSHALDLSGWQLSAGGMVFKIPDQTHILSGKTITFSPQVTGIPLTATAELLFPSGGVAAAGPATPRSNPEAAVLQPASPEPALSEVQAVETNNPQAPENDHGVEAAIAPAAQASLAAVGAAVPVPTPAVTTSEPKKSVFASPWSWGLIGTVIVAAGAFIFL